MTKKFPSFTSSAKSSESGVNALSTMVNDGFGWIFRRNHNEYDFGIDGHIDIVTDDGGVTGQSISVQIKSGASYFRTETPSSYTFYGETKHLNYYINSAVPVILVIHEPSLNTSYWALFDPQKTEKTESGWKISIPKKNILVKGTKSEFISIVGPAVDHSAAIEAHWAFNEMLGQFETIHYAVDRADVESKNTSHIGEFFERIQSSESLCRKFQGKIELSISGYHNDRRELWEIPAVIKWFKVADPVVKHWFYFCDASPTAYGLKTYFLCQCKTKRIRTQIRGGRKVNVDFETKLMFDFLELNWPRLNEMIDSLGMSIEENKRISYEIMDMLHVPHGA